MTGRDSDSTRRTAAWLLLAALFACVGCGHTPRSLVARLRGKAADAPALASTAPGRLVRDPFLADRASAARNAGSDAQRAQRSHLLIAGEAGPWDAEHAAAGGSPRSAELSYLDVQLERIDSALEQWERPAPSPAHAFEPPPVPFAAGFDVQHRAPTARSAPDPQATFEHLARREERTMLEAFAFADQRSPGFDAERYVDRSGESFDRSWESGGSTLEELAPSPAAGGSHLSMIVDSDLLPRRVGSGSVSPGIHSARPRAGGPDFLAVDAPPAEAPHPFRSAAFTRTGTGRAMAEAALPNSTATRPAEPEFISSGWPDRDPPEILPDFELSGESDARSAPAAPDVAALWHPHQRGLHAGRVASSDPPRTLRPLQFADEPVVARAPALNRLRGPLVIALGLLLVGCGAAALRRHAADRPV